MTPRLLIVEDTQHVRDMLAKMLELDGFEIAGTAADGASAVEMAKDANADVIVMDYAMPGMDGLEASKKILEAQPSQKIILYTAYPTNELEQQAHDAGIVLCLGKVEGLETLERHISQMCRKLAP
ncbi:MAG TPA: response regulator [Actinomycetota bacterium]|nr:response regulator [Actinomycetota bacterium]